MFEEAHKFMKKKSFMQIFSTYCYFLSFKRNMPLISSRDRNNIPKRRQINSNLRCVNNPEGRRSHTAAQAWNYAFFIC